MDVSRYLARLDLTPSDDLSAARLALLHERHLLAIPFENLDVQAKREITLDVERLFEKVIVRRRGGFCYELNGLFAELLTALGFTVKRVAARVHGEDGQPGRPFDHLALIVTLADGEYLCDVGFGDSFRKPLRFSPGTEQTQLGVIYRIVPGGDAFEYQSCRRAGTAWKTEYTFTTTAHPLDAFREACVFHQTSPDSIFTRKLICSKAIPDGRITLTADRFIVSRGVKREETPIASAEEFARSLARHFGIAD